MRWLYSTMRGLNAKALQWSPMRHSLVPAIELCLWPAKCDHAACSVAECGCSSWWRTLFTVGVTVGFPSGNLLCVDCWTRIDLVVSLSYVTPKVVNLLLWDMLSFHCCWCDDAYASVTLARLRHRETGVTNHRFGVLIYCAEFTIELLQMTCTLHWPVCLHLLLPRYKHFKTPNCKLLKQDDLDTELCSKFSANQLLNTS